MNSGFLRFVISTILVVLLVCASTSTWCSSAEEFRPFYKKLMPSVLHIESSMFFRHNPVDGLLEKENNPEYDLYSSDDRSRILFQGFVPNFVLIHSPRNPLCSDGLLYKEYEELAQRIGSFVGFRALDAEENSAIAEKVFAVKGIPAFRYFKQGLMKKRATYFLPRLMPAARGQAVVTANEMEDFVLTTLVERKRSVLRQKKVVVFREDFDHDDDDDDDDEDDEDDVDDYDDRNDPEDESVMNNENTQKNEQDVSKNDESEILLAREKRRTKIMDAIAKNTTKKLVVVMRIQYPSHPSPSFLFAEADFISRKVKRLESWFLLASADPYVRNNVGFALIKEKLPSSPAGTSDAHYFINESIRISLALHHLHHQRGHSQNAEQQQQQRERERKKQSDLIAGDVVYSLEDLKSNELKIPVVRFNTWKKFVKALNKLVSPLINPVVRAALNLVEKNDNDNNNNNDGATKQANQNQRRQLPEEASQVYRGITYRPVVDTCKTLRECMRRTKDLFESKQYNKSTNDSFDVYDDLPEPFVIRSTPEFHDPSFGAFAPTLDDLLRIYTSDEAAKFMVNGALPSADYVEGSVRDITSQWIASPSSAATASQDEIDNDEFLLNVFQSHVVQEKFPLKLPKEFAEFAVSANKDDAAGVNTKNTENEATKSEFASTAKRGKVLDHLLKGRRHKDCLLRMSPLFTYEGCMTVLHSDPSSYGGGWMHLWAGRKIWEFIHPRNLVAARRTIDLYGERNLEFSDDFFATGSKKEILYLDLGPGDTVIFPPGWLHRVWTLEKSIGAVGYVLVQGSEGARDYAMEQERKFEHVMREEIREQKRAAN